jgi:hypothetical protein
MEPLTEETVQELRRCPCLAPFYLAGETGLALRLGHRRSADLDFFSFESFQEDALIQQLLQRLAEFSVVAKAPATLHTHITGTKVSFLAFGYPLLFPCEPFLGVNVADARDIACMKVNAIASRGTKRDFIDLYVVSQTYGLPEIIEWFRTKFAAANYSMVHILKSLTFFDDAENDPPPKMLISLSWDAVKNFFTKEVPGLL